MSVCNWDSVRSSVPEGDHRRNCRTEEDLGRRLNLQDSR